MKKTLLTIFVTIISFHLFGQITNGNFEEWESFSTYDKPMNWQTNQDSNFVRFIKDTISYEGNYSLHAVPSSQTAWFQCGSYAALHVKFDEPLGANKSLNFYIRALSVNVEDNTSATISGRLYQGDTFLSYYEWQTDEEFHDYTKIEIPLEEPSADSMLIFIYAAALDGASDGCTHRSQVWLDHFHIDNASITTTESFEIPKIEIFPNPSHGYIDLKGDVHEFEKYIITDFLGRELKTGIVNQSRIKIDYVGLLFFILENKNGQRISHKIINHNN